jgi:hypothetical protein
MTQSIYQLKIRGLRMAVLAAIVVALAGSRAEATTIVRMDAAELSDQAELVFTGTPVQSRVVLSKDGEPYTFVTFTVHDVLKGWTLERQLALRFDGGETSGGTASYEGMPRFEQGETYLLFVHGNGSLICPVLGWWQGQYRFGRETGSGKQILLDSAGVPLRGVVQGRFDREERIASSEGMTVLSEEGVHIEVPERTRTLRADAEAVTPAAAEVIGQLRSFITGRAKTGTFQPGQRVDSARMEDLPARRAVPAVRQK